MAFWRRAWSGGRRAWIFREASSHPALRVCAPAHGGSAPPPLPVGRERVHPSSFTTSDITSKRSWFAHPGAKTALDLPQRNATYRSLDCPVHGLAPDFWPRLALYTPSHL